MVSKIVVVTFVVFFFYDGLLIEDVLGVSVAWVVLAILLLVLWNYRGLQIKISYESISVNYRRFDIKAFLQKDIVSSKKTKAFGRYMGVGVRVKLDVQ
jgi:hypothetical protein